MITQKKILLTFVNRYSSDLEISLNNCNLTQYENKEEFFIDLKNQDITNLLSNLKFDNLKVNLLNANICKDYSYSEYEFYILDSKSLGFFDVGDEKELTELYTVETRVILISTNYKLGYHNYLQTKAWHNKRNILLKHSDYKCNRCSKTENLQAHHLNYNTIGDESLSDLELVCVGCHKKIHKKQ